MKRGRPIPASSSASEYGVEAVVLPHLDSAYRLARWLMRNDHDAEDAVQEASLRAIQYFRTFDGGNARAWFLRIVRNVCHSWRGRNGQRVNEPFDEEEYVGDRAMSDPEALALRAADVDRITRALATLPERFRTLLVLRELEGLSYRELAEVIGIPIGTVMSSLSRARHAFRLALLSEQQPPGHEQLDRTGVETVAG
jgi:RNA polymerase sigma-70 factor (ECF subfamily)